MKILVITPQVPVGVIAGQIKDSMVEARVRPISRAIKPRDEVYCLDEFPVEGVVEGIVSIKMEEAMKIPWDAIILVEPGVEDVLCLTVWDFSDWVSVDELPWSWPR